MSPKPKNKKMAPPSSVPWMGDDEAENRELKRRFVEVQEKKKQQDKQQQEKEKEEEEEKEKAVRTSHCCCGDQKKATDKG